MRSRLSAVLLMGLAAVFGCERSAPTAARNEALAAVRAPAQYSRTGDGHDHYRAEDGRSLELDRAGRTLTNDAGKTVALTDASFKKVVAAFDAFKKSQEFDDSVLNRPAFQAKLAEARRKFPHMKTRFARQALPSPSPSNLIGIPDGQRATSRVRANVLTPPAPATDGITAFGRGMENSVSTDCYGYAIAVNDANNQVKAAVQQLNNVLQDFVTFKWNTGVDLLSLAGQVLDFASLAYSLNLPAYLADQAVGLLNDYLAATTALLVDNEARTVATAFFNANNCMSWAAGGPPDGEHPGCTDGGTLIIEISYDGGFSWALLWAGEVWVCA